MFEGVADEAGVESLLPPPLPRFLVVGVEGLLGRTSETI